MNGAHQWGVYETRLESALPYTDPLWDVSLTAQFRSPSGRLHEVEGFWDGGQVWVARICADEVGDWTWQSSCSNPADTGLGGRKGRFQCVPYDGGNPLCRHGFLRVAANARHLEHADGAPFFWLGDTAWNGPLRATSEDWELYLRTRREQAFSVIQFVTTQWRGASADAAGQQGYHDGQRVAVNPPFFQRLDAKLRAINDHGLVGAPVALWALTERDPGLSLAEKNAIRLARYIVARWNAYHVVWLLGGDGRYKDDRAERWRRIGRAVFGDRHDRPVTMHPCGRQWVADEFRGEPWFDFIGYQSGHRFSAPDDVRWLVEGGPATDWRTEPRRPIINLEPNYEAHPCIGGAGRFGAFEVRRAAYWSLLVSPTAGVTYGHNCVWPWQYAPGEPEGHEKLGITQPWDNGLDSEGVRAMTILRRLFESLAWHRLVPAPELLAEQPGKDDPRHFIAVARAAGERDGAVCVVAYLPVGGGIALRPGALPPTVEARWFDPRLDQWSDASPSEENGARYAAPDNQDWVLVIHAQAQG